MKRRNHVATGRLDDFGSDNERQNDDWETLSLPEIVLELNLVLRRSEALSGFREFRQKLAILPSAIQEIAVEIQCGATTNDLVDLILDQRCTGRMPHEGDIKEAESHLREMLRQLKCGLD